MNWRIISTLIIVCSLGWLNNYSLIYLDNISALLAITFSVLILLKKHVIYLVKKRGLVIVSLCILIIISVYNSYLLPSEYSIFSNIILNTVTESDNKTKLVYYKELIEGINSNFSDYPLTSFSMLVEIEREIDSLSLICSKLLNYLLNNHISPIFPTTPNTLNKSATGILQSFLLIMPSVCLAWMIKRYNAVNLVFWTIVVSSALLAVVGIYYKYLYINGMTEDGMEILGLWSAPEPRISFSGFTYKNHWSAYSILNLSMIFTIMLEIFRNSRVPVLRSNRLISLSFFAILHLVAIFYSDSNSGIILSLLFLMLITFFVIPNKPSRRIYFYTLTPLLLILPIFIYENTVYERLKGFSSGESFRLHLWSDLLMQIKTKTFWGYGIDSYQTVNGIFQSSAITEARLQNLQGAHQLYIPITVHAHSDILQILSEFGFAGTCIFIFPVIFIILRSCISLGSQKYPIISLGLFIFLLYSIVDFPFRNIACLSMFAFLLTFSLLQSKRKPRTSKY